MREIKRTQQQPIPTYRGPYFPAAAAQTWPQLGFRSGFLASRFSRFWGGVFPEFTPLSHFLDSRRNQMWFTPPSSSARQLGGWQQSQELTSGGQKVTSGTRGARRVA